MVLCRWGLTLWTQSRTLGLPDSFTTSDASFLQDAQQIVIDRLDR